MSTYVLVHGVAHGAWCWQRTRADLESLGHEVVAMDLPLTSLADDAAAVSSVLDRQAGRSVVLVGHSYGGLVISAAAAGRAEVRHLVYVAAVMLDAADIFTERSLEFPLTPLAEVTTITEDGRIVIPSEGAASCFYNECSEQDARDAAARMRPTAFACLTTPSGAEPWRQIPSTYVLCERDRAVHPICSAGWQSGPAARSPSTPTTPRSCPPRGSSSSCCSRLVRAQRPDRSRCCDQSRRLKQWESAGPRSCRAGRPRRRSPAR